MALNLTFAVNQATNVFPVAVGSVVTLASSAGGSAYIQYSPTQINKFEPPTWIVWPAGVSNNGVALADFVTAPCVVQVVVTSGAATFAVSDPVLTASPLSDCWQSQGPTIAPAPTGVVATDTAVFADLIARGGAIKYTVPGVYLIGDGPTAGGNNGLLWSHAIPSDTSIEIGAGVTIVTQSPKSFLVNQNIQSNKVAVTSATYATSTPFNGAVRVSVVLSAPYTLSVGNYVMFKNDSARFLQGVYRVETVTDSTHFTYLHFGPNTASGAQAIGVGTIMYKCDANIRIFGDGLISYDGALTGAGSLQTMGCIFNKVGNFYWNIRTEKSLKYGMYYANTWVATVGTPKASNPSNPIQGVGPIHDLHILPLYGESTDDPTALTTSNSGYTPYDLKDADGTKSSDGEVSRVEVDEICPSYVGTRCFLMFVDGAAGDITDVHFKRISNTATATATTGLSVGACLTLSGINIVGAAMRGIRIDHVTVGVPSPTNTQIPIQIGQSTDNAPFDFYGSIGRVEHVRLPGGAATDGSQCGLINVLGTAGGNGVQVCELDIGEVKAYVDTLGSSNIKVINFTPGGASTLKIGKIDVRQVNPVYTSSPTRGILAVFFDARTASKLIVDQMHLLGAMTAIQSDVLSDGHIIQIGRIFRDSGGQLIAGLLCHLGSVTATYGDIINIGGSYLLSNITAGKTVEIYINSLVSQGGARFLGIINAAGTLRLGIGKCDVTGAVAGTQTSLTIQLGGNIVGNQRGSTPLGIDVNLLDSTMANHLMGATVWNTNANPDATRQGMGFPAATAIGLYQVATTAGAAKFIRVGT